MAYYQDKDAVYTRRELKAHQILEKLQQIYCKHITGLHGFTKGKLNSEWLSLHNDLCVFCFILKYILV